MTSFFTTSQIFFVPTQKHETAGMIKNIVGAFGVFKPVGCGEHGDWQSHPICNSLMVVQFTKVLESTSTYVCGAVIYDNLE